MALEKDREREGETNGIKKMSTSTGYNAQKAESDMVYTFESWGPVESTDTGTASLIVFRCTLHDLRYRPSGKDLPPQEIKLPPTFQTIVGA